MRSSLNGVWILDKSRGSPSMRFYLETMGVNELAIEANEKGDADHDTIHDIALTDKLFRIKKLSRVNDLTMEVTLGSTPQVVVLNNGSNGESKRTVMAQSDHTGHVRVESELPTINGTARVTDIKTLIQEEKGQSSSSVVYVQELTVLNEKTMKRHTTTRYFVPHSGEIGPTALTAGGNKRGLSTGGNSRTTTSCGEQEEDSIEDDF